MQSGRPDSLGKGSANPVNPSKDSCKLTELAESWREREREGKRERDRERERATDRESERERERENERRERERASERERYQDIMIV